MQGTDDGEIRKTQTRTDLPIHHTLQQLWTFCSLSCQGNRPESRRTGRQREGTEAFDKVETEH